MINSFPVRGANLPKPKVREVHPYLARTDYPSKAKGLQAAQRTMNVVNGKKHPGHEHTKATAGSSWCVSSSKQERPLEAPCLRVQLKTISIN